MSNKKIDKKKLFQNIVAPILIVVAIIVMWVVKTYSTSAPGNKQTGTNADFMLEATSIDLDALKEYNLPIIIDFGADSCLPCKEMAPVLIKLNADMQGKAIIKFVDVWKNSNAARGFPVQVIPTQVFINADGTPYVPSNDIQINFNMYTYKETGEHAFTVHQGGLTEKQLLAILADMGVTE